MKKEIFSLSFSLIFIFLTLIITLNNNYGQEIKKSGANNIRFDHFALNVPNPVERAYWYVDNLGWHILHKGTAPFYDCLIVDSGNHMKFEFFNDRKYEYPDLKNIDQLSFHIAFMTNDVKGIETKLLAAGAKLLNEYKVNSAGDEVVKLQDPWGMTMHFVKRGSPIIKFVGIRVEHFGFNVTDAPAKADWYVKNLGMKILRESGSPTFGRFVSDQDENTMFEFAQNDAPVPDYKNINQKSMLISFESEAIELLKKRLISAGAQLVEDIHFNSAHEQILILRDPWGQAIQFITRIKPVFQNDN